MSLSHALLLVISKLLEGHICTVSFSATLHSCTQLYLTSWDFNLEKSAVSVLIHYWSLPFLRLLRLHRWQMTSSLGGLEAFPLLPPHPFLPTPPPGRDFFFWTRPPTPFPPLPPPSRDFFFWAQFSRKLARLYEYSYLGPVLYMNIHIAHDTKVFVTLREKKSNEISICCP